MANFLAPVSETEVVVTCPLEKAKVAQKKNLGGVKIFLAAFYSEKNVA